MKVKVRIAPSPTGFLHVGTAQSALYNWLFARKNGGEFYLRIEDTDKERSIKEYEHSILDALTWLGLQWDGKIVRQSERGIAYRKALEKLITEKKIFWCNHTKEELESERSSQELKKEPPRHICDQKSDSKHHVHYPTSSPNVGWILRLAVDENSDRKIIFDDIIRGPIEFKAALLGDFSIAKSLNEPLYNFAVAVDDSDMGITHVIRGEDHISNTPKQILIYEALDKILPQFAHLPLILASDRSKLSKRHGAIAVVDFKKDYLPEALLNFLGSMSYTFSKEIMTKEEMIEEFELSKVHKSGAVFDVKKLNWLNSQYIKQLNNLTIKQLTNLPEIPDAAISLITERLEKLSDVQNFDYFWKEPSFAKASEGKAGYTSVELLRWRKSTLEKSVETLVEVKKILEEFDFSARGGPASGWEKEELRKLLDGFSEKVEDRGLVYWPLRVALTGKEKSPDPVDVAMVLGKELVLKRISQAIKN